MPRVLPPPAELQPGPPQSRRHRLLTRLGLGGVALFIVGELGYLLIAPVQHGLTHEGAIEARVTRGHTSHAVIYDPAPPVGGEHDPTPQACGFYASPFRNENAVHSLEHGAVWITYRPDLASDQLDRLRALALGEDKILVSPYDDLPAPIVVSSWGRQLWIESELDSRLRPFMQRFRGVAPERFAPCVGVGAPASS
jgi:hypothetical protein